MAKFQKGQSGNPSGRKPGSGFAVKLRRAIEDDMPEILAAVVDAAKQGDMTAAKMLLDRTVPALKPQAPPSDMSISKKATLTEYGNQLLGEMAEGRVSPENARSMMEVLTAQARLVEFTELEQRLMKLEERSNA